MAKLLNTAIVQSPKTLTGLIVLFWKFKFLIFLLIVLLPTVADSINVAIQTKNPTLPFVQLAMRIFTADNDIQLVVNQLNEDPVTIVGTAKPEVGIWLNFVYFWKFFWRVIFRLLGNLYLVFFPLYVFFKLVHWGGNISTPAKNFTKAFIFFMIYLFVINTLILVHGLVAGNTVIVVPDGLDKYEQIFLLFKFMLPFHGIASLIQYLIQNSMFTT